MHAHLGPANIGGYRYLEYHRQLLVGGGGRHRRSDMLDGGFTTMRVVGSADWTDVGLKQAIEAGYVVGPADRAGRPRARRDRRPLRRHLPAAEHAKKDKEEGIGDSPEELKYQVRRQRKFGAEVIKVCATGGVFSRGDTPGQQQLTEEELRAIADEAHMQGLRVAAHAHGARRASTPRSAPASTRSSMPACSTTRASSSPRRASGRSGSRWTSRTPTTPRPRARKNGELEENLRKDREIGQIQRDNFRKAHDAGVQMMFGSDAGVDAARRWLASSSPSWSQYGMTPLQAIQAATRNAAQALGREQDVGVIAVGRYGDLVAVTGDPTQNVRLLEKPDAVVKGGVLVPRLLH